MTAENSISRRQAAAWASGHAASGPRVDVLIPTRDRPSALAVTLAGLAAQDDPAFAVIVSDQSRVPVADDPSVSAMVRVLRAQGRKVDLLRHIPPRGMAEQRQFLLHQASSEQVLYLDDDVWLEPGSLQRMCGALDELRCGFVGMAVQGLSYLDDRRPHEQAVYEPWDGPVLPERVDRSSAAFDRHRLHNAANLTHLAAEQRLDAHEWRPYKVAWIGGCVLYRTSALVEAGGFEFWRDLPQTHVGEDVLAEWRVMERFGGAGILPSGAVHLELPTTLPDREVEASVAVGASALAETR
ncbi:glycosyltransferase family 2 protein [Rathayibacter sp. KR2-224]|uniref:glycosyltransferase family 2 protein n=1 Tax=Rathayibacter sp. KR2-224 TaxID=3400913 RepID=UPI003C118E06